MSNIYTVTTDNMYLNYDVAGWKDEDIEKIAIWVAGWEDGNKPAFPRFENEKRIGLKAFLELNAKKENGKYVLYRGASLNEFPRKKGTMRTSSQISASFDKYIAIGFSEFWSQHSRSVLVKILVSFADIDGSPDIAPIWDGTLSSIAGHDVSEPQSEAVISSGVVIEYERIGNIEGKEIGTD